MDSISFASIWAFSEGYPRLAAAPLGVGYSLRGQVAILSKYISTKQSPSHPMTTCLLLGNTPNTKASEEETEI